MTAISAENQWLAALGDVSHWLPPMQPTVVIAPHPDDETLGAGGLIAMQRRRGVPVEIVAVTDGEAAYVDAIGLGEIRRGEQEAAVAELGVEASAIVRLGLPDGKVTASESALIELIRPLVGTGTFLVAPWAGDTHPDHEACGRVAEQLARDAGMTLASYMFWAWHRKSADELTALPLYRLELDAGIQAARNAALAHHRSQLDWKTGSPVLPDSLLEPARRPFETFIIHG